MDVVLLAGGEIPAELKPVTGAAERALLEVAGRPLISRVIDTLVAVPEIVEIFVVTTPRTLESLPGTVRGIPSGDSLVENLFAGLGAALSETVLVVTGDVPLVTEGTWSEFLQ